MTEGDLERILSTVADLPSQADANSVYGKPVTVDGRTVIPAAEVTYLFEVGSERGVSLDADHCGALLSPADEGSAGIRSRPVALIEVGPDKTRVKPVVDMRKLVPGFLLLAAWTVFCLTLAMVKDDRGRR